MTFVLEESKEPALVDKEDSDSHGSDARSNESDDVYAFDDGAVQPLGEADIAILLTSESQVEGLNRGGVTAQAMISPTRNSQSGRPLRKQGQLDKWSPTILRGW